MSQLQGGGGHADRFKRPNLLEYFFGELSNNVDELDCLVPSILLPAEPSIHKFFGNSVYEKTVMDADSDLGGKFSDESGNFFTISPYTTKKRK